MGCSSSNRTVKLDTIVLNRKKEAYNNRHERFEQLLGFENSSLECIKRISSNFSIYELPKVINELMNINPSLADFNQDQLREVIIEILGQDFINDNMSLSEYDLFDIGGEYIFKLPFYENPYTKELVNTLIQNFARILPKKQKGAVFAFEIEDFANGMPLTAILTNFKFNNSYQIQVINLLANKFILSSEDYCKSIGEIVDCNFTLTTVLINIHDEKNTKYEVFLNNLVPILKSVCCNKSVKVLIIQTIEDGKMSLTPEIEREILNIVKADHLFTLYLGKLELSDMFMKGLSSLLINLKKLRILALESTKSNINMLEDIMRGVGRNRSLNALLLAGFQISEEKITEYKQVQKFNECLKVFEYNKQINIF